MKFVNTLVAISIITFSSNAISAQVLSSVQDEQDNSFQVSKEEAEALARKAKKEADALAEKRKKELAAKEKADKKAAKKKLKAEQKAAAALDRKKKKEEDAIKKAVAKKIKDEKKAAENKIKAEKKAAADKLKAEQKAAKEKAKREALAAAALGRVEALIKKLGSSPTQSELKSNRSSIVKGKKDIEFFFTKEHSFYPGLALLNARAKTASKDRKSYRETWDEALLYIGRQLAPSDLQKLNEEAALAAAKLGMVEDSDYFYKAASDYSDRLSDNSKIEKFTYKTDQIRAIAPLINWEELKLALEIYREDAQESFEIIQYGRFMSILTDCELQLAFGPETDDKRSNMSKLLKEVQLHSRIHNHDLTRDMKRRIRDLTKAIKETYNL